MAEKNSIKVPSLTSGETKLKDMDPDVAKKLIDAKADVTKSQFASADADKEKGWLGKFFGINEHSSNNIAGLFILILLIIGTAYTVAMICFEYEQTHKQVLDFWDVLVPMITLALGYIFGNRHNQG